MDLLKSNKWNPGPTYGPVLTQTDLFLLGCEVELHPILLGKHAFTLEFDIVTGHTSGFNQESRTGDLPFIHKDEPATLPRVKQLYLITDISPWCTTVTNDNGVTLNDICGQLYRDYANVVTSGELNSLPPRVQEGIRKTATSNMHQNNPGQWPGTGYYTPGMGPGASLVPVDQVKRSDWLRDRRGFDGLHKNDAYAIQRLGYKAPNIFVFNLTSS